MIALHFRQRMGTSRALPARWTDPVNLCLFKQKSTVKPAAWKYLSLVNASVMPSRRITWNDT